MNHLKTGNSYFRAGSYVKYKFGGKELQETGMYDFGARMYMADIGRWFAADPLAEANPGLSVYRYGFNNPVMFTDPNGMLEDAALEKMWSIGGEWKNNGNEGFDYGKHTVDYTGNYSFNPIDVDIEEVIMKGKGNKETWNNSLNFGYNSNLMMSKITGALGNWNLDMRRNFYYNEVARTGADKIERNFYLMFGGALAAPFAGAYIAALGGETAASYLEGTLIRGVTDMALQKTIKGSIDWKQTGINAFIGGGSGAGAVQVNWLNYGGNMVNNFGTSYYDGGKIGFMKDFGINSSKAFTGIFGMGVVNYNGLTNGNLNGYFGTTLLPGMYFNVTDIIIEKKIK
jgi:RHS repeat-associated protein